MACVRPLLFCLLCLALGRGWGGTVQLTGLVEFGSLQRAYLLLDPDRSVELAVGQTRSGYTLLRLDAHSGWCELQQGSNVFQLTFASTRLAVGVAGEPGPAQVLAAAQRADHPRFLSANGGPTDLPGAFAADEDSPTPTLSNGEAPAVGAIPIPGGDQVAASTAGESHQPPAAPPLIADQLLRIRIGGNAYNDLMRQRMWAASQGLPLP
jgi:hypothetical protein